jgi:hypothetical protein
VEGWNQNRKLVQAELGRLARAVESLDLKVGGEMTNMKVELATLKTKVAIIVVVASAAMSALINYFFRH